jgi:hypothetical protein
MGTTCRTILAMLALAAVLPAAAGPPEAATRPLPYGLEAMERLDFLPYLAANGTQTKQFTSYDTAARNGSNVLNFKRYEEKGEWVFFDEIGPGCLYRQQMNVFFGGWCTFPHDKARIRLYFDGEPKPRIDMTFDQFFGKDGKYTAPFTPPLAYFDVASRGTPGGNNRFAVLYYPFAFQKRLKITVSLQGGMQPFAASWYQYTYLKYPSGTTVKQAMRSDQPRHPMVRCRSKTVSQTLL